MPKIINQKQNTNLAARPPIVVVMGHIDHGKTKLLDYIRKTNVVEKESGGITQHVGAYEAEIQKKGDGAGKITFIDTPGHEAFSKMRSRGAAIADIAVLVVAADEGVKPQTLEALEAIKKAGIPFIVALNKIDKENAELDRVKKELSEHGIQIEEWGGKVPLVPLSAKTGENVGALLEMILLVAELEELRGDLSKKAEGVIIESHLDPRRGIEATLLLRDGALKAGDYIRVDDIIAKVKIFEDYRGKSIKEARFSSPVRVVGWEKIPQVGSSFQAYGSLEEIEKSFIETEKKAAIPATAKSESGKEWKLVIPMILKADVAGSLEAIEHEISKLSRDGVFLNILRMSAGDVNENDVKLASGSPDTLIIGFRAKADKNVVLIAERYGIPLKFFDVIYELSDWLKQEIDKRLPQEVEEIVAGKLKVLKIFSKEKNRQVVGGRVLAGKISVKKEARITRRDFPISEGRIIELQQGKIKTAVVEEGNECGILVESSVEIAPGDIIEVIEKTILANNH